VPPESLLLPGEDAFPTPLLDGQIRR
jgi:hypothetical protein